MEGGTERASQVSPATRHAPPATPEGRRLSGRPALLCQCHERRDWHLLVAWLLAALRPCGPYPVLNLHGEQGSTKSTLARLLRALVDPNKAPLRAEPAKCKT